MAFLCNMRIGVRLIACFLLVAVLTGVAGFVGIINLPNNQATSQEIFRITACLKA